MPIFIFGHKNPDTDSVCSAIALSHLKNIMGKDSIPCVLGHLNKESKYVLDYFSTASPILIENVKVQLKDLYYGQVEGISPDSSILSAYRLMESNNFKTLPIVDEGNYLRGIVTMKDIAMGLIKGNFYLLDTSLQNIAEGLGGKILVGGQKDISGKIRVMAFYYETVKGTFSTEDIIIVGDRHTIIEDAIEAYVKLIIVTGGKEIPQRHLEMANVKGIPVISTDIDTYTASKLINQCNFISSIMKSENIIQFSEDEYLEEIKDEMLHTNIRNFPVTNSEKRFLGFINKSHIINPQRKRVILVDHNEYSQSVEGLPEAEILEIIDHHKIGDISTSMPISFRNIPVGSTCTIVFNIFRETNITIPHNMAGILLSGIISDTLFFKSPTTTEADKKAVEELNHILKLDIEEFAMEMFKAGTSLEGFTIEEIFYRDFKEFYLDGEKVGIGQVFTLDIDDVFGRKNEFIDYINKVHDRNRYDLTMLVVTDIIKEGSYLLYQSNHQSIIALAFNVIPDNGVFVEELVSRKKQILPKLMGAIKMLK